MCDFKLYSPCCNWYLEIHTDCSNVAELVVNLFGGFIISQKVEKENLAVLEVTILKCDFGYIMSGKGREYKIKEINGVGFYLYAVIDKLIEGNMNERFCVLHGGVIAKDNQAYCVIAPTMTGKSTFITYFSLNGYDYLADDYIFVDREKNTITPLPLPVSLRDTTVLGDLLNGYYAVSGHNELRGEQNTLVSLYKDSKIAYSLDKILFIQRGAGNTLRLLNKGELYKTLLFNMKNALALDRECIAVGNFIDNVCGYWLSYNDFEYVAKCINSI